MWSTDEEARRLAERFRAVKNRAAFARDYKVPGKDAMIYQHITGLSPISLAAAEAYARGFHCSLEEISPRLAAEVASAARHLGARDGQAGHMCSESLRDQDSDREPVDLDREAINEAYTLADDTVRRVMSAAARELILCVKKRR